VGSARNTLDLLLKTLDTSLHDWSSWDDMYNFVQRPNPEFIRSNLPNETFTNQNMKAVIVWNRLKQVTYSKAFDRKFHENPELAAMIAGESSGHLPLLNGGKESQGGIFLLSEADLAIAAQRPILSSKEEGEPMGELVFVRRLTGRIIDNYSQLLDFSIEIRPMEKNRESAPAAVPPGEITIAYPDSESITGRVPLPDIRNAPAACLTVRLSRNIYDQGRLVSIFYHLVTISIILLMGAMGYIFLHRRIVARIEKLGMQVDSVDLNSEEHRNTAIDGDDEISSLASDINSMLDIILSSQREIEKKTDEIVRNEQYLSQLINSISAGVLIVDPETRAIEAINDFALRLSGFSREEVMEIRAMASLFQGTGELPRS
jgi:sensor domain CHASE-containing protein